MKKRRVVAVLMSLLMMLSPIGETGAQVAKAVELQAGTNGLVKYPAKKYALKIMLDAGHYGNYYNKGATAGYYESNVVWNITEEMAKVFAEYDDIKIGKTRTNKQRDLGVVSRGKKAKGYDLFISNHTNSAGVNSPDYPLVIIPYESKFYTKMKKLGGKIGYINRKTMNTRQNYQVRTETYRDWRGRKKNSFGVIRGAAEVGVPGLIVEYSFHSNKRISKWLLNSTNLKSLARKNAETIAAFYGARKSVNVTANFNVETTEKQTNIVRIPKTSTKYSYEIYWTLRGGTLKKLKTVSGTGGAVSYEHKTPYKGKTVYYVVRPVSSTSVGKYSKEKGVLIKDIGTPVISAKQYEPGVVKVSWSKADSAEKYTITKKWGEEVVWEKTYNSSVTSYLDAEVEDGEKYSYQVTAWGTDGENEYIKNSRIAEIVTAAKLDKVKVQAVSKEANTIKLSWPKDDSVTKYIIYRSDTLDGEYKQIATRTGNVCTNKNLVTNQKYYYKVKAVKDFGEYGVKRVIYSEISNPVSCTVMIVPPAKVINLKLTTTSMKVTAKWQSVKNSAGYQLAYKAKGGNYTYVKTSNPVKTIYGLKKNKTYQVKVRAYKKTGTKITYGSWSLLKSITCK